MVARPSSALNFALHVIIEPRSSHDSSSGLGVAPCSNQAIGWALGGAIDPGQTVRYRGGALPKLGERPADIEPPIRFVLMIFLGRFAV